MKQQYVISFEDRMNTYGLANANAAHTIECICGLINRECEKGSRFLDVVYVDQRPSILLFEKDM